MAPRSPTQRASSVSVGVLPRSSRIAATSPSTFGRPCPCSTPPRSSTTSRHSGAVQLPPAFDQKAALLTLGTAGDSPGGKKLLEREVPEAHLVAPPDHDAAVELLRFEKPLGRRDAPALQLIPELVGDRLGRPAPGNLDRAPLGMILHRQRQLLQQIDAPLGRRPTRALLALPRQPLDDRLVEVGPLLGQPPLVPVHHGQRGEHHRIAGHSGDRRPPERGRQLLPCLVASAWLSGKSVRHQRSRNVCTARSSSGSTWTRPNPCNIASPT